MSGTGPWPPGAYVLVCVHGVGGVLQMGVGVGTATGIDSDTDPEVANIA